LRRTSAALAVEEFPQHLIDLMGLLGDPRTDSGMWDRFAATPAPTSAPTVVLLGSSDYSAQLAGQLGLPFAFANHFDNGGTLMALDIYRGNFQPSEALEKPYAIVTANVLTADTEAEAAYLAAPGQLMIYGIRTGRLLPLMSPHDAARHLELAAARRMRTNRIVGAPDSVVNQVEDLVRTTTADEIMISTFAHAVEERVRSLGLLAQAWFHGAGHASQLAGEQL
jgi:luciferase family oxidoreductase group 1